MGMGGGLGSMAITPELQEKMKNSPGLLFNGGMNDTYFPNSPLGGGPLGSGMGKFDSTNTTTTADMMGGDRRDPNSQQSTPFQMLDMMGSLLQGRQANGDAAPQTAQQQPTTVNPNPNTSPGSFAGPNTYSAAGSGAGSGSGFGGGSGGPFPLQGQYGIVKMAGGGLADAAQNMAGKGREGDSMLVHMSPGEVKGLQALAMAHGGSLTINPETGLPEAFKLGKVLQAALPIAAGFALGPAGFGLMSAGAAGLTVGGLYALGTGSIEKGLMAGLGAWGGAGLGGAGASTAAPGTTGALTGPAATAVSTPTAASLTAPLTSSGSAIPTALGAQPTVASITSAAAPTSGIGISAAAPTSTLGSIAAPANALTYQAATPGIGSSIANFAKTNPWTTAALVGGPLLAGLTPDEAQTAVATDKGMIRPYEFKREINREAFKQPTDGSTAERNYFASQKYTPLPAYAAAEGGQVPRFEQMAPGGLSSLQGMRDGYGASQTTDGNIPQFSLGGGVDGGGGIFNLLRLLGRDRTPVDPNTVGAYMTEDGMRFMPKFTYDAANQAYKDVTPTGVTQKARDAEFSSLFKMFNPEQQAMASGGITGYNAGGISTLGGYSDGGRLLKGPGDGVSDSIPATINNKQPARLADGEFVIPARIVSEIGNGSTDAGARKLYAMMNRVQNKRRKTVGKGKVAVNTKADKDLPV
jgi:hypothetical protein